MSPWTLFLTLWTVMDQSFLGGFEHMFKLSLLSVWQSPSMGGQSRVAVSGVSVGLANKRTTAQTTGTSYLRPRLTHQDNPEIVRVSSSRSRLGRWEKPWIAITSLLRPRLSHQDKPHITNISSLPHRKRTVCSLKWTWTFSSLLFITINANFTWVHSTTNVPLLSWSTWRHPWCHGSRFSRLSMFSFTFLY